MGTPFIGVLALQGDVREHVASFAALEVRAGAVRSVADLQSCDALVIPGGESTTMSRLAEREHFLEPLRAAQHSGMPMFGTCAGMIMLANQVLDGRPDQQTIGGIDITVRRNAFGRQIDSFESPIAMPVLGRESFLGVFIRAPWVEQIGPKAITLAKIEDGSRAGTIVAVRQGALVATSFHPELTNDTRVHRYFVDLVMGKV
jgi:5'-phosphate synthase pdxT subunit